jgi:ferritin-like metal-binding protein YciE
MTATGITGEVPNEHKHRGAASSNRVQRVNAERQNKKNRDEQIQMQRTLNESDHINPLKGLLVDELRDLLHAEGQLVQVLPKMAEPAHHPKLKEAFQKHLEQTEGHVDRLKHTFELLGEDAQPKPCKAMMGLIEEGKETIKEGEEQQGIVADLGLIAAAQKVEHYEISGYGTARSLARQIGERDVATLLAHTLGEEESSDYLLTELAKPLMQLASSGEAADDGRTVGARTVHIGTPDPKFGNMLLEQFGGANGELAAARQYSIQGLNCDDPDRKDLLMDIGMEELSHLEIVGTLARMHLMPLKNNRTAAEVDPLIAIAGGGGVALQNSMGDAWTADYLKVPASWTWIFGAILPPKVARRSSTSG